MKNIIRHYVIDTLSLYIVSQIVSGIILEKGIQSLLMAGLGIMLTSFLVKPLLNLLLLPLNLVTFGLFRWLSSSIALYIATLLVPSFKITNFVFSGLSSQWLDIPSLNLPSPLSYIAISFLLTTVTSAIYWLIK